MHHAQEPGLGALCQCLAVIIGIPLMWLASVVFGITAIVDVLRSLCCC